MATTEVSRLVPPPESKLRPPPLRPGVIARERLHPAREAAARARVVVIAGPAGYGKSTLAAEWSAHDPRATAWVQLDSHDDDVVMLLSAIAGALDLVGACGSQLAEELSRRRPRIDDVVPGLLANALEDCSPLVLVLEDAHVVTTPKSLAVLATLADHISAGSQLMLVTRGEPRLPLGRLRASGELVEIGPKDLALDVEETRAVAAGSGLELTAEAAAALRERTEGWAAAVVLAALSLRGRDDAAQRAASLSGEQQDIADFLLEEVLGSLPEELTTFLLGTSVLQQMTAPLCNAVLRVDNAADSLEALARSNAFVIPLDDHREWYRYHHLFADLLRAELKRRHPELLPLYLVRAASWCEVYGSPDRAFAYALGCGDLAQAGRIALANRDAFIRVGRSETVRLWFERCTDEEIASDAQLSIAAAWAYGYQGDEARAARYIAAAEQKPLDAPSPDGAQSLASALACLRAAVAPNGVEQMLADGEFVRAAEKKAATKWYFSGARAAGVAQVLLGHPAEALAPLREVVSCGLPEVAPWRVMALGYLAGAAAELGNHRDAQRWARQAVMAVEDEHLEGTAFSAVAHAADARVQVERGDHTAAGRRLEDVRSVLPRLAGARWLAADIALRCAEVSLDLGDRPGAVELAQIADDALQGYPDPGTLPQRLQQLEQRIRLGRDYGLTAAELRLIHFLPTHLSLQEIADQLNLSRPTVKTHIASIYSKLGVQGRSEAVELISEQGLGSTLD